MNVTYTVVFCLLALAATTTFGSETPKKRFSRDVNCRENEQYPHSGYCCLNCPAGTYVEKPCSEAITQGTCAACPDDTYTEHSNGLYQCLRCSSCRTDEVPLTPCSKTQNRVCQCKAGFYCPPDQVCEACKKCLKCKSDEKELKNCSTTSNTVCEKKGSPYNTVLVVLSVLVVLIVLGLLIYVCWKKRYFCKFMNHSSIPSEIKIIKDNQNGDGREDIRTAGQTRQTLLHQEQTQGDSRSKRLVPLNGQESLKKSFHLFEELDVKYHNRFFRRIGLSDNTIHSASDMLHADKVYELLRQWMEIKGMKADVNELIDMLRDLDQKLTADNIVKKLVNNGEYSYEDD